MGQKSRLMKKIKSISVLLLLCLSATSVLAQKNKKEVSWVNPDGSITQKVDGVWTTLNACVDPTDRSQADTIKNVLDSILFLYNKLILENTNFTEKFSSDEEDLSWWKKLFKEKQEIKKEGLLSHQGLIEGEQIYLNGKALWASFFILRPKSITLYKKGDAWQADYTSYTCNYSGECEYVVPDNMHNLLKKILLILKALEAEQK